MTQAFILSWQFIRDTYLTVNTLNDQQILTFGVKCHICIVLRKLLNCGVSYCLQYCLHFDSQPFDPLKPFAWEAKRLKETLGNPVAFTWCFHIPWPRWLRNSIYTVYTSFTSINGSICWFMQYVWYPPYWSPSLITQDQPDKANGNTMWT